MKTKLLFQISVFLVALNAFGQGPFQESLGVGSKNYHDLNMEPLNDGTGDFIVAANQFDTTMTNEEITLHRVKEDGSVVWVQRYSNTPLDKARVFDITIFDGEIFLTGSIDVGTMKQTFISQVNSATGAVTGFNHYGIISPNFNSRGLKIVGTNSDADGDSVPDPGFVVVGFFSDCYNVDTTCNFNNIGYVLRTDISLVPMWSTEIDANNPINNFDYDFANGITETIDGFFITGSATGVNANVVQQAVLAHKIDLMGVMMWDRSYIFGNSQDVSVDAYYDVATDEIFMLNNYSVSHYFGVTVYGNATGVINGAKSWYASGNDQDKYGFKIMESFTSNDNLIISGYDRDENWVDVNSNSQFANSSLFVYEFEKANGNPVGLSYQYLVPHVEPVGDEFNFWNGQLPLMYYPDISFPQVDTDGTAYYYHVGYRTVGGLTNMELFKTDLNRRNECENVPIVINPNPLNVTFVPVTSAGIPTTMTVASIGATGFNYIIEPCSVYLSVSDNGLKKGSIFPNPATEFVNFTLKSLESYVVIDTLGRVVSSGNLSNETQVYVGDLNNGVYFIKVFDADKKTQTYKLIKK